MVATGRVAAAARLIYLTYLQAVAETGGGKRPRVRQSILHDSQQVLGGSATASPYVPESTSPLVRGKVKTPSDDAAAKLPSQLDSATSKADGRSPSGVVQRDSLSTSTATTASPASQLFCRRSLSTV